MALKPRLPSASEAQPFLTSAIPGLDPDAHRARLSRPSSVPLPISYLERWELRQRQQVGLLSNADLFAAALTQVASDPTPSVEVLRRLAVQIGMSTRLLLGLALSNSSEMLRVRRDAHLEPSSMLLSSSKETLRCAPLNANKLFGGRVQAVAAADKDEQLHASVARNFSKRPAQPSSSAPPAKKQKPLPVPSTKGQQGQPPSQQGSRNPTGYRRGKSSFPLKPSGKSSYRPTATSKPSSGPSGGRP